MLHSSSVMCAATAVCRWRPHVAFPFGKSIKSNWWIMCIIEVLIWGCPSCLDKLIWAGRMIRVSKHSSLTNFRRNDCTIFYWLLNHFLVISFSLCTSLGQAQKAFGLFAEDLEVRSVRLSWFSPSTVVNFRSSSRGKWGRLRLFNMGYTNWMKVIYKWYIYIYTYICR